MERRNERNRTIVQMLRMCVSPTQTGLGLKITRYRVRAQFRSL